jgi:hypothetical protein
MMRCHFCPNTLTTAEMQRGNVCEPCSFARNSDVAALSKVDGFLAAHPEAEPFRRQFTDRRRRRCGCSHCLAGFECSDPYNAGGI